MNVKQLNSVARAMVAPGKGILAADESSPTIKKRFDQINTESTEENRRVYRQMLFTTAGAEQYIGGVILFEETLGQSSDGEVRFPKLLASKGMIPGIKVDKGAKALAGYPGETVTEGLDGLRERLAGYREQGAQFAKWRAVIDIDEAKGIPSRFAIEANAHALARYAALCQEADIVPIVEPEVLMDGAHSIEVCQRVTEEVLVEVYRQLALHRVVLEGTLLKPNMVISGKKCSTQASVREVAAATAQTLLRTVPGAVPGIVFLSGGQSSEEATAHLNAINAMGRYPWEVSFSYGRALQASPLQAWSGRPDNIEVAKDAFFKRAKLNGLARSGDYDASMESAA
ncbi:MAG: fructose-bisphosphate aldolase class I [Gammaproteobacteria bacterium]|nr:fructose-bisphosphate aldolase class I [Gammaproteobacteria bacterium]MDH3768700.1 fructose-bisphosphate aldolase class I [Gammaproteobacteria bacterium]